MRCHPYLFEELQLLQSPDKTGALNKFNEMLYHHLGYTLNRGARALAYAFTGGSSRAAFTADDFTLPYYKLVNRFSACFALTADMSLGLLAGDIKRKEMLSGRLADIHSYLFIATSILKYYERGSRTEAEQDHAQLALEKAFHQVQEAFTVYLPIFQCLQQPGWLNWSAFPLVALWPNQMISSNNRWLSGL